MSTPQLPPLSPWELTAMEARLNYDKLSTWGRLITKPPPGAGSRFELVIEALYVIVKVGSVAIVAVGATWLLWGTWPFVSAAMLVASVVVIYLAAGRPFWGRWR